LTINRDDARGTAMRIYPAALFALDEEKAHHLALGALRVWGNAGAPFRTAITDQILRTRVAGLDFANPLGLAAGLDKNGEAVAGLWGLGFGAVEAGTLTPLPQPGNPRPRLFRLVADGAIINRMGFNNHGIDAALGRLAGLRRRGTLGINVGANKDSADRIADYALGVAKAAPLADYVAINISSPNTPGLRDLQRGPALAELLAATDAARRLAERRVPLFLKVAPDLEPADIDDIARQAITHHIDALIVSNTTVSRPPLLSPSASEAGGLSGAPLRLLARRRLSDFRAATGGALPLVSVGGIDGAEEAYARIRAGASLVQLYTALIYEGPGLPGRLLAGLARRLQRDGFASVGAALGVDAT
jgi:dihydroorotate dehydrogenase